MILKEGMWIAQGPQTNVLLLLGGKSPMLEVIGAIDLNHFKSTGEAKGLEKSSPEVQDILMYPEKYNFQLPSITDAIESLGFSNKTPEAFKEHPQKDKIIEEGLNYYKRILPFCSGSLEEAKTKTRLFLFRKFNISYSQASAAFALIAKICKQ